MNYTPLKISNGTPNERLAIDLNETLPINDLKGNPPEDCPISNGKPNERLAIDLRAMSPINELKGNPPEDCPISNLHRCNINFINSSKIENLHIYGIYFICCIYNYLEVVEEQMMVLDKGLLDNTHKLIIFITNYDETDQMLDELLCKFNKNEKFILVKSKNNLYEKFSINNYKTYIDDIDYLIYYFHTKCLKPSNHPDLRVLTSRRKLLNYYTLEKYNINIKLLELYDAVGCSLHLYPKKHFSGNFWWSKSTYVNTLNNINDKYLSPEMYILSNDACKYISLSNDTNNIDIDKYQFKNDDDILCNLTTNLVIIDEHQKLMFMCD